MSSKQKVDSFLFAAFVLSDFIFKTLQFIIAALAKNKLEVLILKNYQKSDYALNKFSRNIVYPFGEISLEDFLVDNPGMTEEDFNRWKEWSDENLHEIDNNDTREHRRAVSLNEAYNVADRTEPSVEEQYIEKEERECAVKTLLQLREGGILTETQYRRFRRHIENGMSFREIAAIEGVFYNAIEQSIHSFLCG